MSIYRHRKFTDRTSKSVSTKGQVGEEGILDPFECLGEYSDIHFEHTLGNWRFIHFYRVNLASLPAYCMV